MCVHECTSACFQKMQLTMVFSRHLHLVQPKLQEQATWDRGCVQNWPNLVFSPASLRVKTWGRSSVSFSPLQTKPEPGRWEKPVWCAYQRQCAPNDGGNGACCDFYHFFNPPMFSPAAPAWPLPDCRRSQHLWSTMLGILVPGCQDRCLWLLAKCITWHVEHV